MPLHSLSPQQHLYLERLVDRRAARTPNGARVRLAPLHVAPLDAPSLARLLAGAYEHREEAACFAPGGQLEEWESYARELLAGNGCGPVLLDASFTASVAGEQRPQALIVTTTIGSDVAHIAQLVVDRRLRRRGVAEALVGAALAALEASGFARVTLLVSRDNSAARRLYTRLGFEPCGQLVFAAR